MVGICQKFINEIRTKGDFEMNWKDDDFLRVKLADTAPAPVAVKGRTFERQITFIVKPKRGQVYRKKCPEFAKDTVINLIEKDENTDRYFIEE